MVPLSSPYCSTSSATIARRADYLERAYRLEQDPEIAAHLVDVRWALGEHEQALETSCTIAREIPTTSI